MWRLCLIIRDVINTCDDIIYNLLAYVCDWSLGAHKIMHPILSLKSGVTHGYVAIALPCDSPTASPCCRSPRLGQPTTVLGWRWDASLPHLPSQADTGATGSGLVTPIQACHAKPPGLVTYVHELALPTLTGALL